MGTYCIIAVKQIILFLLELAEQKIFKHIRVAGADFSSATLCDSPCFLPCLEG